MSSDCKAEACPRATNRCLLTSDAFNGIEALEDAREVASLNADPLIRDLDFDLTRCLRRPLAWRGESSPRPLVGCTSRRYAQGSPSPGVGDHGRRARSMAQSLRSQRGSLRHAVLPQGRSALPLRWRAQADSTGAERSGISPASSVARSSISSAIWTRCSTSTSIWLARSRAPLASPRSPAVANRFGEESDRAEWSAQLMRKVVNEL